MSKSFGRGSRGSALGPISRQTKRGYFEQLEDRRLLSITPSVDVFDASRMTLIDGGNPGATIEAKNIALDLKIALERVRDATGQVDSTTVTAVPGAPAHFDQTGRIQVSVSLTSWSESVVESLEELGVLTSVEFERGKVIEGWIAPALIEKLAALPGVDWVSLPEYAVTNVGAATTLGDTVTRASNVRSQFIAFGIDGSGVKVGVISNGAASRATSIASGDLPSNPLNLIVNNANDGDEGTAMLEIVYDLAPGASLYFAGAHTVTEFQAGISWLQLQGVDIIVDDLGFFGQPYFTDGVLASDVDAAVSNGVTYITAAGNHAQQHYQTQFSPSYSPCRFKSVKNIA